MKSCELSPGHPDSQSTAESWPAGLWILLSAAILAIAVAGALVLWRSSVARSGSRAALSVEERAYLGQLGVTDMRMSATRNFVGAVVTSVHAQVTNRGTKSVQRIEIQLEFHDTLNQVVLLERAHPISTRTRPLKPGETRAFQVSFDHVPVDWNRALPTVKVTGVQFLNY